MHITVSCEDKDKDNDALAPAEYTPKDKGFREELEVESFVMNRGQWKLRISIQ